MGFTRGRLVQGVVGTKGQELSVDEVRRVQLAILDSIHRFCEGRGLAYFLTGGTLLGAVRHGGYIPWDDDIDVAMPRADYERFVGGYVDEANPHLAVLSMQVNPDYYLPFAKVVDLRTVLEEEVDRAPAIGVYVDVFPVDNLSDEYGRAVQLFRAVCRRRWLLLAKNLVPARHRHWTKNVALLVAKALLAPIPRRRVLESIDRLSRRYESTRPTRYAGVACFGTYGLGEIVESDVFARRVLCRFEGGEYYMPAGYDRLLRGLYGDYMTLPPPCERVSHHRARAWWASSDKTEGAPGEHVGHGHQEPKDVSVK